MRWDARQLDALLDQVWQSLEWACGQLEHPFRTPALGTAGPGGCALRAVILRQVDALQRRLVCHTDHRSAKVSAIRLEPRVEWLFYDLPGKVQVRAAGLAKIHHNDDLARDAWAHTPVPSRRNYCALPAPGREVPSPEAAWPIFLHGRDPTREESEVGWKNFAVIETVVEHLEFLQLDPTGHRRAAFTWDGKRFAGTWLAP